MMGEGAGSNIVVNAISRGMKGCTLTMMRSIWPLIPDTWPVPEVWKDRDLNQASEYSLGRSMLEQRLWYNFNIPWLPANDIWLVRASLK
eukprot:5898235-Amphidinium_carterae.1